MKLVHSETVEELIPLVQKVLHNCSEMAYAFKPEQLKGVQEILDKWKSNKNLLRENCFKNHLIAEFGEVSVHIGEEQRQSLAEEFIGHLDQDNWQEMFPDNSWTYSDVEDLVNFLSGNIDEFFNNKTICDFVAPDGTVIGAGSKISKSFKHFFEDEDLVRKLQDKFSALIQQDKITGTLCASIHPLDYLSISENNYKWRSCHALNGEFAGGNASYMMDGCTIVFYLRGAEYVKLPRFPEDVPWNDKKWRMLMFLKKDESIVWAGRQYPFFSQDLLDMSLKAINELLGDVCFYNWQHKYLNNIILPDTNDEVPLNELYIYHGGAMMTRQALIKDAKHAAHYNDLLHSSFYIPYYSFTPYSSIDPTAPPKIIIGHTPVCACCGREDEKQSTNLFICDKCEYDLNPPKCGNCGKPMVGQYNNIHWYPKYGELCLECQEKLTEQCSCGLRHVKGQTCSCQLENLFNEIYLPDVLNNFTI